MPHDTIALLRLALDLARLTVSKARIEPDPARSPYQKVIVGFADLATRQAEGLLWAIENGNKPVGWTGLRVITEMIFSLDYINKDPEFQEYRSCLLLREAPERGISLYTSPDSPFNDPTHPAYEQRLKGYEDRQRELLAHMNKDEVRRGPDDPDRWVSKLKKPGVSAWMRAKVGNWQPHYAFVYEVGSAFVHADGYAIEELHPFHAADARGMAEQGAVLLTIIILELVQEYPTIEQVPEVAAAWEAYKLAYNALA
jgi:hypothetical protein